MSETIVIDAEITAGKLRPQLSQRAQRYRGHQRTSAEEALKAFEELAAARKEAAHGEWGLWLAEAGINDTTARAQLQLFEQIQQDPRFADRFRGGWLSESTGRELLSAPAEVQEEILSRPPESKPPTVAEVREAKREATTGGGSGSRANSPPANRATSHDLPARPAHPPTPLPAPEPTGEVIAEIPAEPAPALAPPPAAATPALAAPAAIPSLEAGLLKNAEAMVALLEMALADARVERDQLRSRARGVRFELPDAAVELAAKNFLASPAVRGAAGFLAFNAVEAS